MPTRLTRLIKSAYAKVVHAKHWVRHNYKTRLFAAITGGALAVVVLVGWGTYAFFASIDWGDLTEGSIVSDSRFRDVPPGFKEYRTVSYHFSVLFPEVMEVKEYGGKGDSLTVIFVEPGGQRRGYQIFATPYNDPVVGGERFKMDNPSGVYREPQDVTIAGVRATIFFSVNTQIGETREAWFIRNGMLYEVNAKKEFDEWLSEQMQSWMFVR